MFALRCTRKLLDRVEGSARCQNDPPRSNNLLGDWTATLMIVRRQHLMVAISNVTLLPVIALAAPYSTLPARFTDAVGQVLAGLDIDPVKVEAEANAMREVVVARTNDRRVLGSLNDFTRMLDAYVDGRSLLQVALHLADTPCGPLKMESPRDVTRERFSRPVLRLVKG